MNISVNILVKNEEYYLEACLNSLQGLYDELVVMYCFSDDSTLKICEKYKAVIVKRDEEFITNFSSVRNLAVRCSSSEIVMWVDADNVLSGDPKELRKHILNIFEEGAEVVSLPFFSYYSLDGDHKKPDCSKIRFVKKNSAKWTSRVHEYIVSQGLNHCSVSIEEGFYIQQTRPVRRLRNTKLLADIVKEGHPSPYELHFYGRELTHENKWEEAKNIFIRFYNLRHYDQPIQSVSLIDWKSHSAFKAAECFYKMRQFDAAREWALRAVSLSEEFFEPFNLLGMIESEKKNFVNASAWFRHCISLPDTNRSWFDASLAQSFIPWEWLAISEWYRGNKKQATICHKEAKIRAPDNEWIKSNEEYFQ